MKKSIVVLVALFCVAAVSFAQPKALGIRGTYGAELSYQHYVGGSNFLEFDAGLFTNILSAAVIYDIHLFDISAVGVYAGPGAFFGMHPNKNFLSAGLVGQLGLEYNFPTIPLQISIDWRPHFNFVDGFGFIPVGAGLGIRYRF